MSIGTRRSSARPSRTSLSDAGARTRRPAPAAGPGADGQAAARRRRRAARRPRSRVDRVAAHAAPPADRRPRQSRPRRPARRARGRGPPRAAHVGGRAVRGGLRGLRALRARRPAPVHAAAGVQARAQAAGGRRPDRALPAGRDQRRPRGPRPRRLRGPARLGRPPSAQARAPRARASDARKRHGAPRRHARALGAGREGPADRLDGLHGVGRGGRGPVTAAHEPAEPVPGEVHQYERDPLDGLLGMLAPPHGERLAGAHQRPGERVRDREGLRVEPLGRRGAPQQLGHEGGELAPDVGALGGERAGSLRDLAEQDGPGRALALHEREHREQAVPELLVGRRGRVDAVAQRVQQPHPGALHAGAVEALLGAEVGVDHRLGDPGRLGDRVDGRRVEASLGERAFRRIEHLRLAHPPRDPPGPPCVRIHGSRWHDRGYITPRNLTGGNFGEEPRVPIRTTSCCAALIAALAVPASAAAQGSEKADPAGGAAIGEVVLATAMAAVVTAVALMIVFGHRSGRVKFVGRAADHAERLTGVPGWASLPNVFVGASLLVAVIGIYWDISLHIDNGRDPGPLANPAHYLILFGLFGIFVAGLLGMALPEAGEKPSATAVRLTRDWYAPLGAVLMTACAGFALSGFPLDDVWHRLCGQDVTLWGPTHLMLIGGASLATLAAAMLIAEGARAATKTGREPDKSMPVLRRALLAGAFLVGLSTVQAEFDFSVPQFRLLYHPVLLMLAASIALVTARIWIGRGGALMAVFGFILIRGLLTVLVGGVWGQTVPHFPLYAVEAICVEVAALDRKSTTSELQSRGHLVCRL